MTNMPKLKEFHFAGEIFQDFRNGWWESYTGKIFITSEISGRWFCHSRPSISFEDLSCDVSNAITEEEALKEAIIKYYEIQVKVCEYELHRYKKILFVAQGH